MRRGFSLVGFFALVFFTTSTAQSQTTPATPLRSQCSLAGELIATDLSMQGLTLRLAVAGEKRVVPFSRKTDFLEVQDRSMARRARVIEPTDLRPGDLVCVRLDPSQAIATTVFAMRPLQVSTAQLPLERQLHVER